MKGPRVNRGPLVKTRGQYWKRIKITSGKANEAAKRGKGVRR